MKQVVITAIMAVGLVTTAHAEYWRNSWGTPVTSGYGECVVNIAGTYDEPDEALLACGDAEKSVTTGGVKGVIQFAFDSSELDAMADDVITRMNDVIPPGANVTLVGHTDAVGTEEYNMALGLRRANAVDDAVDGANTSVSSKGETELLVDVPYALRDNRRVEFEADWEIVTIKRNDR